MTNSLPRLFTVEDVADATGQTPHYVTEQTRARNWPCRRFARGDVKFTADDFAQILELCAQPAVESDSGRLSFAPRSRRGAA